MLRLTTGIGPQSQIGAITVHSAKHLQNLEPSYIREILSAATHSETISLAGGLPASDHFPLPLLHGALETLTTTPTLFQYGETRGYGPLLECITKHYSLLSSQSAMVCNGSQQALDLIARAYINPGDTVVMEAPSYLGALQVFALSQAQVKTIPQGSQGPDLQALETLFQSCAVKFFYAVPDFHNPTGLCWSLDCRLAVARLCRQYNVSLIEDAPYRQLRFSGDALPLVSSMCPERAFILYSFSKIVAPGLRLGLLVAPSAWLATPEKIKQASDLHCNQPLQAVLLALLNSPELEVHIEGVCALYRQRFEALAASLRRHFGDQARFSEVQGGMFSWFYLPEHRQGCEPMALAREALNKGVAVVPGDVFYRADDPLRHTSAAALRLNFSHSEPGQIDCAIARLKCAFDKLGA